jgi:hypothetical protein
MALQQVTPQPVQIIRVPETWVLVVHPGTSNLKSTSAKTNLLEMKIPHIQGSC